MMQLQNTTSSSKVAFVLSVFFALVLAMLSVADSIYYFWPEWLVLVLIFWCYTEPDRYGPLTGFILGILLDVLTVKTFGVLSLGLVFIAFFVNKTSHQMKVMTTWQQSLLVALFLAILKFITGWVYGMTDEFSFTWSFWYSIIGSMIAWPFLTIVLGELRRVSRIR